MTTSKFHHSIYKYESINNQQADQLKSVLVKLDLPKSNSFYLCDCQYLDHDYMCYISNQNQLLNFALKSNKFINLLNVF